MVTIIETICDKYNLRSGEIITACNRLSTMKKGMNTNNTYLCQSNHFEIISAIYNKIMKLPLIWTKGHKGKHGVPLDRWETLNMECNHREKLNRKYDQPARELATLVINIQEKCGDSSLMCQ